MRATKHLPSVSKACAQLRKVVWASLDVIVAHGFCAAVDWYGYICGSHAFQLGALAVLHGVRGFAGRVGPFGHVCCAALCVFVCVCVFSDPVIIQSLLFLAIAECPS